MEILFVKSIKKHSLTTNADSVAASLSFSVLARTTSLTLAIEKLGKLEIRPRKISNSAKVKINVR